MAVVLETFLYGCRQISFVGLNERCRRLSLRYGRVSLGCHSQLLHPSNVFGLSAKLMICLAKCEPASILAFNKSHLLRNKTSGVSANSLFETIDVHNWTESACRENQRIQDGHGTQRTITRRLTFGSSARTWSKQEMGARNMMAFISSKKGTQAAAKKK